MNLAKVCVWLMLVEEQLRLENRMRNRLVFGNKIGNKWLIMRYISFSLFIVAESRHMRNKQFRLVDIIHICTRWHKILKVRNMMLDKFHMFNVIQSNVICNSFLAIVEQQFCDYSMGHAEQM